MATTKILHVPVESDLGRMLHDELATGDILVVDTGEATYRLEVAPIEDESVPPPRRRKPTTEEAAASREAILAAAGSWKDNVDAEGFKAYIAERRRSADRPPVKL